MPNAMMEHGPATTTYFCGGLAGNCAFQAGHGGSCVVDPCHADSDEEMARDLWDELEARFEAGAATPPAANPSAVRTCDACGRHSAQRALSWPVASSPIAADTPPEDWHFFCSRECFDFYAYAEYHPDLTPNTPRWPEA